jgi:hypothetical protein
MTIEIDLDKLRGTLNTQFTQKFSESWVKNKIQEITERHKRAALEEVNHLVLEVITSFVSFPESEATKMVIKVQHNITEEVLK